MNQPSPLHSPQSHLDPYYCPVNLDSNYPQQSSAPMFSPYFNKPPYQSLSQSFSFASLYPQQSPLNPAAKRPFSLSQPMPLRSMAPSASGDVKPSVSSLDSLYNTSLLFKEDSKEVK